MSSDHPRECFLHASPAFYSRFVIISTYKLLQCQFGLFAAAVSESNYSKPATEDEFQYKATQDVVDDRSYEPYLIDYHEDTNTFTFNDPWINMDQPNDSCCKVSESSTLMESQENDTAPTFVPIAHASVESTSASEVKCCDHIRDGHESNTTESRDEFANYDVTAEHVPEVSFPIIANNNKR